MLPTKLRNHRELQNSISLRARMILSCKGLLVASLRHLGTSGQHSGFPGFPELPSWAPAVPHALTRASLLQSTSGPTMAGRVPSIEHMLRCMSRARGKRWILLGNPRFAAAASRKPADAVTTATMHSSFMFPAVPSRPPPTTATIAPRSAGYNNLRFDPSDRVLVTSPTQGSQNPSKWGRSFKSRAS